MIVLIWGMLGLTIMVLSLNLAFLIGFYDF